MDVESGSDLVSMGIEEDDVLYLKMRKVSRYDCCHEILWCENGRCLGKRQFKIVKFLQAPFSWSGRLQEINKAGQIKNL